MFCQQWSYFRYNKEVVEVSNQKYKRPMETSAAPVCHLDLCESEVVCSAHWWSSLEITSWSRIDHFCEPAILQKNSVKYGVHIIDLHSYYSTAVLSFLILRNSESLPSTLLCWNEAGDQYKEPMIYTKIIYIDWRLELKSWIFESLFKAI